jgi:hypothetical protein
LLNQNDGGDPVRREELQDQLDWLDAMLEERIESRKEIPRIQRPTQNDQTFCVREQSRELEIVDKGERSENEKNEQGKMHDVPEFEENEDSYSTIEKIIFGDGPSIDISQYEKAQIEQQIDLWQTLAFDADLNRDLPERHHSQDRNIFENHDDVVQSELAKQPQLEEQLVDQIMTQQVQQHLQSLIHLRLTTDLDRSDLARDFAQSKEDKENEREDPGREHSR